MTDAQAPGEDCRLTTANYVLTALQESDIEDLFAHFSNPEVTAFLGFEPHSSTDDGSNLLNWVMLMRAAGTGLRWRISQAWNGAFVGTCGFHRVTYDGARRGEIGYDVSPGLWGRGVMSEVLPAVLVFGYGVLDLHRIEALVTVGNERSCRLLERHGFRREGLLRDHGFWRGRYWDQIAYARLRTDAAQASLT